MTTEADWPVPNEPLRKIIEQQAAEIERLKSRELKFKVEHRAYVDKANALLRQLVEPLIRACDTAMHQSLVARIPECGEFGGIAQDLDFCLSAIKQHLWEV